MVCKTHNNLIKTINYSSIQITNKPSVSFNSYCVVYKHLNVSEIHFMYGKLVEVSNAIQRTYFRRKT